MKLFYEFSDNRKEDDNITTRIMISKKDISKQLIEDEKLVKETISDNLKDVEKKEITRDSFKRINKKLQLKSQKVITRTPSYETEYDAEDEEKTKKRYQQMWEMIQKINKDTPGYVETLHLFNLGLIEHRHFHNKPCCPGCGSANQSKKHSFEKCDFTNSIWRGLNFSRIAETPFTLTELTTPVYHITKDVQIWRKMSIWIDTLKMARYLKLDGLLDEQQIITTAKFKMKAIHQKYGYKELQ